MRSVAVRSRDGNRLNAMLTFAKPAFLPPLTVDLEIERQPRLPEDPLLVFRVTGAVGGLMHVLAPFAARVGTLPPGVRLDGERLILDLRRLLEQHGQADLLKHVRQLTVATETGWVVAVVVARVA